MLVEFGLKLWGEDRRALRRGGAEAAADPPADGRVAPPVQDGLAITDWVNSTAPTLDGKPLPLEPLRDLPQPGYPSRRRALPARHRVVTARLRRGGPRLWRRAAPGTVWAVNITGDGRLAVAAYGDGTIRWHRMDDGVELLALFPFADGENWIAWEPDGRFASTLGRAARCAGWSTAAGTRRRSSCAPGRSRSPSRPR